MSSPTAIITFDGEPIPSAPLIEPMIGPVTLAWSQPPIDFAADRPCWSPAIICWPTGVMAAASSPLLIAPRTGPATFC